VSQANRYLLELNGLTKSFPGVRANDDVSLRVQSGEVHALLGENGAGKSTLVKMIYGILKPDHGEMRFQGKPYVPANPAATRAHGIGMVFQHFSLFEALTVEENIALGLSPELAEGDLGGRIVNMSESYGFQLEPDRFISDLSVGQRQRVEIVRCLLQNPRLIIMDEPTSVLTPGEVEVLFATLRQLASEGCSILYISHKLEEIQTLCQHATILRGGKVVATCAPAEETTKSLAELMLGDVVMPANRGHKTAGAVRLQIHDLSMPGTHQFAVPLRDVSFELRSGEILGVAGVAGNGQDELMDILTGERLTPARDAIMLEGEPIGRKGPDQRRVRGMCFAPEERYGHAAVPGLSLVDNAVLSARVRKKLMKLGFIDLKRSEDFAGDIVKRFDVRTAGVDHAARSLSGGNLQKFIMGREILQAPAVLIASQPTWGVDAGAAAAIRTALIELAKAGAAVLIISQDLDELLSISDRICVIADGRLSVAEDVTSVTVESIGTNMGGQTSKGEAHV